MKKMDKFQSPFKFEKSEVTKLVINNNILLHSDDDVNRNFKMDYKILDINEIDGLRVATLALIIDMEMTQNDESVMKMDMELQGLFSCGKEFFTEEDFTTMTEYNGTTALYGVARGIIASISAVTFSQEVIRLPMLNIAKIVEDKKKQKD